MKNLYILPSDKPSKFGFIFEIDKYHIFTNGENPNDTADNLAYFRNMYIVNDEVMKIGDYKFNTYHPHEGIFKIEDENDLSYVKLRNQYKKIIITTDQDLIKDGVQAIDNVFLEWFINNPDCDRFDIRTNSEYEILYKILTTSH